MSQEHVPDLTRGLFAGISLEGSCIAERKGANRKCDTLHAPLISGYTVAKCGRAICLLGRYEKQIPPVLIRQFPQPDEAQPLYEALDVAMDAALPPGTGEIPLCTALRFLLFLLLHCIRVSSCHLTPFFKERVDFHQHGQSAALLATAGASSVGRAFLRLWRTSLLHRQT